MMDLNPDLKLLKRAAADMIERGDVFAREVVEESGQIFDNCKHMSWVLFCVALEMTRTMKKWQYLNDHMEKALTNKNRP